MDSPKSIRRKFLLNLSAASIATLLPRSLSRAGAVGPNDKIRLGLIGTGGMGGRHLEALAVNPQCDLVAICDVFKRRYEDWRGRIEKLSGKAPDVYQDYRRLLDRKDIDAIFIATPDHWHPLLAIHGCEAGKDVYVEKPVCTTIEEGRAMVDAARRYGRIVQAGTQQRSMTIFQKAMEIVQNGTLGQITSASAWVGVNGWNVGEKQQPPPEDLDWDLWLGPTPFVPYSPQRQFGFMGWHDYARGGQLTNWGIHLMDIVQWGIGHDAPLSIQALGGSYQGGAGADNYETIDAILEYPGCSVTWEQRHSNSHQNKGYGVKFQGTKGQLVVDRSTIIVKPDELGIPEYIGEPEKSWAHPPHHDNFFQCMRTRAKPAADILQGFRSTSAVLLAGVALDCRRKLYWDPENETFLRDEQANRHLSRAYRAPWRLP